MLKENTVFVINNDDANRRIDRVVRKFLKNQSLSVIYSGIRTGKIRLNGKKIKQNQLTKQGDQLQISNFLLEENKISLDLISKSQKNANKNTMTITDINILVKTKDLLFINKKQGQIVHGKNSISELVLQKYKPKQKSLSFKPGPLHRLDKDTSGIICFSQSLKGAQEFSAAIKSKKLNKYYLGVIEGTQIKKILDSDVNGKKCKTICKIIKSNKEKNISLIEFKLISGRKHQIRIQCQKIGTPLLNDIKYGSKQKPQTESSKNSKYFLHAQRLEFDTELLTQESFKALPKVIEAPLPDYFQKLIMII